MVTDPSEQQLCPTDVYHHVSTGEHLHDQLLLGPVKQEMFNALIRTATEN